MAEKAEKKPDGAAAGAAAKLDDKKSSPGKGGKGDAGGGGIGGLLGKTPVLLGAVMVIEAVVLFAGMKFLGAGAHPATAAINGAELTMDDPKAAEGEKGKD